MRVEAEKATGKMMVSDNPDLGFIVADSSGNPLTPNNLSSNIPFQLDDNAAARVGIRAWPVSVTGNKPTEGLLRLVAICEWIMTNKPMPSTWGLLTMVSLLTFSLLCHASSSLGEINIELRGNVVDFTCAVIASDSNKSVEQDLADKAASDQRRYHSTGRVYAEA